MCIGYLKIVTNVMVMVIQSVFTLLSKLIHYVHLFIIHVVLSQLMQNEFGDTALIAASEQGHIKCATVLLKHGADVNYQRKVRLLYVE